MSSVENITAGRYKSSFESFLGVKFLEYGDNKCRVELKIKPEFLNIGNAVHGGIINALCDIALSGAVTSNFVDKAESVVTMQMNVNFLRAGRANDTLTAFGEVVKTGSTIVYVEGGIINQEGKLIAKASGDWFVKRAH